MINNEEVDLLVLRKKQRKDKAIRYFTFSTITNQNESGIEENLRSEVNNIKLKKCQREGYGRMKSPYATEKSCIASIRIFLNNHKVLAEFKKQSVNLKQV